MSSLSRFHLTLNFLISFIWLVNGLFCKILNLAPRHQLIVARILGARYARELTVVIGCAELLMVIWILSKIHSKLCALVQISIIATMNIIEFFFVPDLLLFGRVNALLALGLIITIGVNAFILKPTEPERLNA